MVVISIKEFQHSLHKNIGNENILTEYKEFYLRNTLAIDDINDLENNFLNSKTQRYIEKSLMYYFDKYYQRYMLSMSNIDKYFLNNILKENFSNFFIGVSDEGIITGIPIHKDYLPNLISSIENKLSMYYENIIGLHKKKGMKEILVGDNIYYDFNKLILILKKHTKINIHILKKNNNVNERYSKLIEQINKILKEETIYQKDYEEYKLKKLIKKNYNEKYSTSFHKLIRSEDVMLQFKYYLLNFIEFDFAKFINILQTKIVKKNDVENYLLNGYYIENSLFPEDEILDLYYGNIMSKFLHHYKGFKSKMLEKNITLEPFSKKNPKLKLNSILKNIACFSKQLYSNDDIKFIMIHIELPFIKDKNVYLGLKDKHNVKIIKRTYETKMNTPCTQTN